MKYKKFSTRDVKVV